MSVKTEVETRKVGFAFDVSIEREIRTTTDAKYPDKTIIKASLEGNTETYEDSVDKLKAAAKAILEIKPEEPKSV